MQNNNYNIVGFLSSSYIFRKITQCLFIVAILTNSACINYQYKPEPIDTEANFQQIKNKTPSDPDFKNFLSATHVSVTEWPIINWDLNSLVYAAIFFDPKLDVLATELEVIDAEERTAAQRQNPTLEIPFEHRSGSGDSPWLIGIVTDFLFERSGKRLAKVEEAKAKKQAAEINIEQAIWNLYHALHKSHNEYSMAVKQKQFFVRQQELLQQNLSLLERRQELGQVSQFEVSSLRLELQQIQLRISEQDFLINNSYHELISHTGLQTDKFKQDTISISQIPEEILDINYFESQINKTSINNRFDLRKKLKDYQVFEAKLKLEIENQYPDINLSPGFIFEQGDRIWALGAAWILPLFHNNEGQILQALAERKKMQASFIELQTELLNKMAQKKQNYIDKLSSFNKTQDLLTKLKDRAKTIEKQFELGYSDRLGYIRSKLEVEKAEHALFMIKMDVYRLLEDIESLSHSSMKKGIDINKLITSLNNK